MFSDNHRRFDFWLSLHGENIDFSEIENILQVKIFKDRIDVPFLDMEDTEYPVFYAEIAWLLDLVEGKKDELLNLGVCFAESQIWMIYYYEAQCNMEFDSELLRRMGNLGLKLCVSCARID